LGESLPGPEVSLALGGNQLLIVSPPSSVAGAIGWNCYIGNAPGDEMLQNYTPLGFSTSFTEAFTGPSQGSPPPLLATNGYFALGVITFTSGINYGLSFVISLYDNLLNGATISDNVLHLIPPLPNTPVPGDTFICQSGCDHRISTCVNKFDNLIH